LSNVLWCVCNEQIQLRTNRYVCWRKQLLMGETRPSQSQINAWGRAKGQKTIGTKRSKVQQARFWGHGGTSPARILPSRFHQFRRIG